MLAIISHIFKTPEAIQTLNILVELINQAF